MGLNYGIANRTGAPTEAEAFEILECAWEAGVRHFDTAPGYHSESIIGDFVQSQGLGKEIRVLTKIQSMLGRDDRKEFALRSLEKSFQDLRTDRVKVVFLHAQEDAKFLLTNPEFFEGLAARFPIESLGISIYDPGIVEEAMESYMDLAYQFPFNVLDERFKDVEMPEGKRYARSIFLQGLLASDQIQSDTPGPLKQLHDAIWADCASMDLSSKELAWCFVTTSRCLDYYLIGVETVDQLKDLLELKPVELESIDGLVKGWRELVSADWLDPRKWN